MPAIRTNGTASAEGRVKDLVLHLKTQMKATSREPISKSLFAETVPEKIQDEKDAIYYPRSKMERDAFRTAEGKKVTEHQWAVYDLTLRVPRGKVSTYKQVCDTLGQASPRSVGSALRRNPFAPFVPCHRVIASDLTLGGFFGEVGTAGVTDSKCSQKVAILVAEGINFNTTSGRLEDKQASLWRPSTE